MTTARIGEPLSLAAEPPEPTRARQRPSRGPAAWWMVLVLLAPLLCYLATSLQISRWRQAMDEASWSLAHDGGPSVMHLATVRDDARRIEARALDVRPATLAAEREEIVSLREDLERAEAAEAAIPDYPGEPEAHVDMRARKAEFFSAVDGVLARVGAGDATAWAERDRLRTAANDLENALAHLTKINADEVMAAADVISLDRHRVSWLLMIRDVIAFGCVLGGTLIGIHGARREWAILDERRRLEKERVAELDLFAGRVAHDLRDPLAAIRMRCSLGARAETREAAVGALARVGRNADRMNAIIDALLAFARSGAKPTPGARSEPAAVIEEVCAEMAMAATQAGATLVVEPIPPAAIACDGSVLAVVVTNLLRNAIRYGVGGRGQGRITVRCRPEPEVVRFEVEDDGPGLPPGGAAHAFEAFVQLADEPRGRLEGIGLGLATVKRLIEANGGRVGVVSRPGAGCRFWFTVRRAPVADAA